MKCYKLLKDLPTFKAGKEFLLDDGKIVERVADGIYRTIYSKKELEKYPTILTDWFEEIPEEPKTVGNIQVGDRYHFINSCRDIECEAWGNTLLDRGRRAHGNCYLTREEAEKEAKWLEARAILKHDMKGFKPNYEQQGVCVYWYHSGKKLLPSNCIYLDGTIRFSTYEDAKVSIKAHEKELATSSQTQS